MREDNNMKEFMFKELQKYDKTTNDGMNQILIYPNPYRDTMYMPTENNQYVQIEYDFQKECIKEWLTEKKINPRFYFSDNEAKEEDLYDNDKEYTMIDIIFQLVLCFIIILTILYVFSLFKNNS